MITRNIIIAFFFLLNVFSGIDINAQELSKKDTAEVQFINARKFFIYKVEKGETLFGISQKFKIPQEEILQFNKDIKEDGLKAKMKIWVPAYSWLKKDSVEKATEVKPPLNAGKRLKIALVTTLRLSKIYMDFDTSESFLEEPLPKEVNENLEFAEGVFNALERLKANGKKYHLIIIDSEGDSAKLSKKIKDKKDIDVIITNETGSLLNILTSISEANDIRVLSCGMNTTQRTDLTHVLSLIPASLTQCEQMGKFAGKYFKNSLLLTVKTPVEKEAERTAFFLKGWNQSRESRIIRTEYSKAGGSSIADSLQKHKMNVIFIPTSSEYQISSILNALKNKSKDYNIAVVGLPTWQYFETIDQNLIESCNVFIFSAGLIDYNSEPVLAFRKHFREKYYTEPSESAYRGYDAVLVLDKYFDKDLSPAESDFGVKGLYTEYHFEKESKSGGLVNKRIHVFQPATDMTTDLMNNINLR